MILECRSEKLRKARLSCFFALITLNSDSNIILDKKIQKKSYGEKTVSSLCGGTNKHWETLALNFGRTTTNINAQLKRIYTFSAIKSNYSQSLFRYARFADLQLYSTITTKFNFSAIR